MVTQHLKTYATLHVIPCLYDKKKLNYKNPDVSFFSNGWTRSTIKP